LGGKPKDSRGTAVAAEGSTMGKKGNVAQGLGRTEEEERIRAVAALRGKGRDGG